MQSLFEHPQVIEMTSLVKQYHSKQSRNNGRAPYAQHCVSAAEIVVSALLASDELAASDPLLVDITCAALGHDLFEDTDINRDMIKEKFGTRIFDLIFAVTNEGGDDKHEAYAQKLLTGDEEALLIKYGDFIDNTISIAYGLPDLGYDWANTFYVPIMRGTERVLDQKEFVRYPKTAALLRAQYAFSKDRLLQNLAKYAPGVDWTK